MRREQFKTPEEDVTAEFDRVCRLFRLALGEPSDRVLFDALMVEANERGMNWVQGLEYVVEHRREMQTGNFHNSDAGRPKGMGTCAAPQWNDGLQQAG